MIVEHCSLQQSVSNLHSALDGVASCSSTAVLCTRMNDTSEGTACSTLFDNDQVLLSDDLKHEPIPKQQIIDSAKTKRSAQCSSAAYSHSVNRCAALYLARREGRKAETAPYFHVAPINCSECAEAE